MERIRPKLLPRVIAVLHARQYVVFFSIALYALHTGVLVLSAWLYNEGSLAEALTSQWGPLTEAIAGRSALIGGVFVIYLPVSTWLRAGYIRSLAGPFRMGAASGRQFASLLGLQLLLEALGAAGAGVVMGADAESPVAVVAMVIVLLIGVAVVYADYIIILADVGPLRAIGLSWRTVRATLPAAALVLLLVQVLGYVSAQLLSESAAGSIAQAAPTLVIQTVVMGTALFAADVTLIVLYVTTVESGRLTPR